MSKIEKTLSIIKPDAVERNLMKKLKIYLKKIISAFLIAKKFILQKMKLLNFIKSINLDHFTTIYANIYLPVQLLL